MSDRDGQVHVADPAKLEGFASGLERGCERLTACMDAMNGELTALGRTWQDDQFTEFRKVIRRATRQLEIFKVEAARARLQLQLDADAARAIHRDPMPGG